MIWKKLGNIYIPSAINKNLLTHSANPLPVHLDKNLYRIFYSGRDQYNRSSVSFFDFDIENKAVTNVCGKTIVAHGEAGSFYSHGISIGNAYECDDVSYILFMGWQIQGNDHWRGDIGRLRMEKKEKLILDPITPFVSSDNEDPISLSYPWVLKVDGIYKMWYGSTVKWDTGNGEMVHVIKYAESDDGINWKKLGECVQHEIGVAQAFSRPTVVVDGNGYHMWYSYRDGKGAKYRIGYAYSIDGLKWKREEKGSGIDVSAKGWDSEMICYPFVLDHAGRRYMFYNGNGYGETGVGLAVLEYQ